MIYNTFVNIGLSEESKLELSLFLEDIDIPNPIFSKNMHLTLVESNEVVNIPNDYFSGTLKASAKFYSYRLFPCGEQNENFALALVFNDTELFDFHHKITNNFKAYSVYDKYIPHISLSYDFPSDFDITTLKKPNFDLIFDSFQGCEIPDISNLEEDLEKLFL